MIPAMTYDELAALKPCADDFKRVTKLLGGARKWKGVKITAQQARDVGATFDDITWAASSVARTDKDVSRRIRLWLSDCAAHVLHIYELRYPTDMRARKAIIAARRLARGEITAAYAARAAAYAAANADAAANAAAYAAKAQQYELNWQFDRLVAWLSEPEPEDWLLPDKQEIAA